MDMSARSERSRYETEVAAYVAAGGDEQVQRVITAVHGLARRLSQWYSQQLSDLDITPGEWAVIRYLAAEADDNISTPSQLADATAVAPSSMTHRLDRMAERGLIDRTPDEENRTRILVQLTHDGWEMFRQVVRQDNMVESDVLAQVPQSQRAKLAQLLELAIAGLDDALK
ncbi:DNA-binding MarR family transcriptional regulator [Flexivirga oryzae]|uniref:DNA-binding MarR family transcriptional regulator n=2 Tax=Flexivirga oryzae TaxID=1794944 RepID=A0A839MYC3_9MICO|nr:DNA-binding MarR family transcriptional regulator [Flexivirga oryzae]